MRSWLITRFLVVLLCMWPACFTFANEGKGIGVGEEAPRFSGKDLSGVPNDSAELLARNKAVMVNFWGLRCGACLEEMPYLNAIYEKKKGSGLVILGINVDGIGLDILKSQVARLPVAPTYPILPDEDLKLTDLFRMTAAPLTLVIDSGNRVTYVHEGFKPGDEKAMEEAIERLLR